MARQRGQPLNATERHTLWAQWQAGQSIVEIARGLGSCPKSVHRVLRARGGIAPPERTRGPQALRLGEREEISRGLAGGASIRTIASRLGRSPSTISREVRRNGGPCCYRAVQADEQAWQRARRPKPCRLARSVQLRELVASKLQLDWSPQQIAGWLRTTFAADPHMQVSHETIYRCLFIQARGVLRKELTEHLRSRRTIRRSKLASRRHQGRGQIVDAVSISERPAEAADRAVPGHWEGDLLAGSGNTHIATLVERHSRFLMLVKVESSATAVVVEALARKIQKLPQELFKSLTWDRGKEMAGHAQFTLATDVRVYFCDPHSPWQRGSNENTNGLLRQYFPKRTDLSVHSQEHLDYIALKLNTRPRETLGFITPAEKLNDTVAATG